MSNKRRVLEAIPEEERSKDLKNLDLSYDHLPIERALGVQWCIESDELGFKIVLKDKPLMRHGVLSTISSIYDPIGMAARLFCQGRKSFKIFAKRKSIGKNTTFVGKDGEMDSPHWNGLS